MCALFWMSAHWNKCACIFSLARVSRCVETSLRFFYCHARSDLQTAGLPSSPKVCWFLAFWTLALHCSETVLLEKASRCFKKVSLWKWHVCLSSHPRWHVVWSFSSESLGGFRARSRSLFEVSGGVLMSSFPAVKGWGWDVRRMIMEYC